MLKHIVHQLLTFRGPRLQAVPPGVVVVLVQSVSPIDALGVREAQLGVPPNIHHAQQDLCRGDDTREVMESQ